MEDIMKIIRFRKAGGSLSQHMGMRKSLVEINENKWNAYAFDKLTRIAYKLELRNHPAVPSGQDPVYWVYSVEGTDGAYTTNTRPSGDRNADGYFKTYQDAIASVVQNAMECSEETFNTMDEVAKLLNRDTAFSDAMQVGNVFYENLLREDAKLTFYRLTEWDGKSAVFRELSTRKEGEMQMPDEPQPYEYAVEFTEAYGNGYIRLPNGQEIKPLGDREGVKVGTPDSSD